MSATAAATANTGGARQSARQTRTNPSRTSKTAGRSSAAHNTQAIIGNNSVIGTEHTQAPPIPHGFYPAITHFTDAILALPREVRRHTSLLKEVDAKAWALEENLQTLLQTASGSQPIRAASQLIPAASDGSSVTSQDQQEQPGESQENTSRRRLFYDLRCTLSEIMFTSDEKNHVLVNTNDELQRQLGRLDAVYPYVEGEVSDEARLGSSTHWAYSSEDPKNKKKNNGPSGNERTRREVAAANQSAAQEADAASRSETRRQAVNTRKNKRTHADLDFEDGRPTTTTTRKPAAGGKNQRSTDTPDRSANSAANTATATPAPAKRRKVEKQAQTQPASTAEPTSNPIAGPADAKDTSAPDAAPKKRTRAPPNPAGRKRNNTVTSNTGPPSAISSPVIGTFNAPRNAASPAPSTTNRPQSSKTQNTAQTQNGRQRPQSSASNRAATNTQKSTPTELPKSTLKEAASAKTESIAVPAEVKDSDVHADSSVTATPADIPTKREETPNIPPTASTVAPTLASTVERQPSVPKGRSKTSTPVTSTFSDSSAQQPQQQQSQPQRSRPTRATEAPPAKRSHKKGASQAAAAAAAAQQQAVASIAANSSAALAVEDDESSRLEDEEEEDETEPRYCYCNQVSFGEMVACDNDTCPREWFHLSCVGLSKPPLKSAKWYCNECKESMRRGNRGNGR